MSLQGLIDRVLAADTVLAALDAGRRLRREVRRRDAAATARRLLAHCGEDVDTLSQLLLVRALARLDGPLVDRALVAMLGDSDPGLRQHAAWALGERPPVTAALPGLLRLAAAGGFGTLLAQLAIERWGGSHPAGHLASVGAGAVLPLSAPRGRWPRPKDLPRGRASPRP